MLSVASLSAFGAGGIGPTQPMPVPVRLPGSAQPTPPPPPSQPPAPATGAAEPGRQLPRGSVLDLSV